MSSKITALVALLVIGAVVTGTVVAQDAKPDASQRRERLRRVAEAAAGVAEQVIEKNAAAPLPTVDGRVVLLEPIGKAAADELAKPVEINNGGLVIIVVPDTQSHPTEVDQPQVEPVDVLQPLGKVRGINTKDGRPLMGGGYTWFLFKPVKEGEATVSLSYMPNGGNEQVDRSYTLNVVAP